MDIRALLLATLLPASAAARGFVLPGETRETPFSRLTRAAAFHPSERQAAPNAAEPMLDREEQRRPELKVTPWNGVSHREAAASAPGAVAALSPAPLPGVIRENCDGPVAEGQFVPVGCVQTFGGVKQTLLAFDASKPLGSRHHWKTEFTAADGAVTVTEEFSSPLVFDLNGDGVRMSRRRRTVDVDGDRRR